MAGILPLSTPDNFSCCCLSHMFFILPLGKSKPFHLQANFTVALVTTLQGDKHSQEAFIRSVAKAKTMGTYLDNMCEMENFKHMRVPSQPTQSADPMKNMGVGGRDMLNSLN